jgi:hypothetical protein
MSTRSSPKGLPNYTEHSLLIGLPGADRNEQTQKQRETSVLYIFIGISSLNATMHVDVAA